jgi:hypothetical protein
VPAPLRPDETPGGTRTRASGLRARRHALRLRGHTRAAPAAGIEPALSRVTAARLTDSTTPERSGGSRTRTCTADPPPYALARRSLPFSAMPPGGRRGSRTPKGPRRAHPFSKRDTAPMAVLPDGDSGRLRTCNDPGKNRELCRLSYGASGVAGRNRTCGAPRFRRALFRLSYGHKENHGRGWSRTSDFLFVRQAL